MNPLETDNIGRVVCYTCKSPVTEASMGIKMVDQDGRAVRVATCWDHH